MADQSNPLTNPGALRNGTGLNIAGQSASPQKPITPGNPQDAARTPFAIDDVTPSGGGPTQVGSGSPGSLGKVGG